MANLVTGRRWLFHLGLLALFCALAVAMTWPLAAYLDTRLLGAPFWHDAYTNTTILATRVQNLLGDGAGGMYENYFFAPLDHTIVFNENHFGLSLLYMPLYLATADPLLAYNLLLLLVLALGGHAMFLLLSRITGSWQAALFGGAAFAFCPFVAFQLGRIQLVALLWIPLCFLFLHRALSPGGRTRDVVGLALVFLLQVGTCMYYALLLTPLLAFVALWLLAAGPRPRGRFWLGAGAVALVAGLVLLAMIWPYIVFGPGFGLSHTAQYIAQFNGELVDFTEVGPGCRNPIPAALHAPWHHEGVAFPGLSVVGLAVFALVAPLVAAWRRGQAQAVLSILALWIIGGGLALGAAALAHSALAALPLVLGLGLLWGRLRLGGVVPGGTALLFSLLVLGVALYLGTVWFVVDGAPVLGLFHYLREHLPGFQSLRKVNRQAILVLLPLVALAGIGLASILERLRRRWLRLAVGAGATLLVLLEFLHAPFETRFAIDGAAVPRVLSWLRSQPGKGPIAALPCTRGRELFFNKDEGLAMHNYLSVFHRKRMVTGRSTWIPGISWQLCRELDRLPGSDTERFLRLAGVEYLVVYLSQIADPGFRERVRGHLERRPALFRELHRAGGDRIYRFLGGGGDALHPTPPAPEAARALRPVGGWASDSLDRARATGHGRPRRGVASAWGSGRPQRRGGWVAFDLGRRVPVVGLETGHRADRVFDAPWAYAIDVSDDGRSWRTVLERPEVRFYRDQLYRPGRFRWRAVLPRAATTRYLRIRLLADAALTRLSFEQVLVWAR